MIGKVGGIANFWEGRSGRAGERNWRVEVSFGFRKDRFLRDGLWQERMNELECETLARRIWDENGGWLRWPRFGGTGVGWKSISPNGADYVI